MAIAMVIVMVMDSGMDLVTGMVVTITGKGHQNLFHNCMYIKDPLMRDMDMDMAMDMDIELGVMDMVMEDMVDSIMGKDLQRSILNKLSTKDPLKLDMAMVMAIAMDMDMVMAMVVMDTVMDMATMGGFMVMEAMEVIIDSWSDLHNILHKTQ